MRERARRDIPPRLLPDGEVAVAQRLTAGYHPHRWHSVNPTGRTPPPSCGWSSAVPRLAGGKAMERHSPSGRILRWRLRPRYSCGRAPSVRRDYAMRATLAHPRVVTPGKDAGSRANIRNAECQYALDAGSMPGMTMVVWVWRGVPTPHPPPPAGRAMRGLVWVRRRPLR